VAPTTPPSRTSESPDLALEELLFGAVSRNGGAGLDAPPDPAEQQRFAGEVELPDDVLLDEDRVVEEHELGESAEVVDDTPIAEPADLEDVVDATDPSGPARGRRRAWVVAGLVTLIVVSGAAAGAVVVGRSRDPAPKDNDVPGRTAPRTTTTATVATTAIPPTMTPATVAPATTVTTRRVVPVPGGSVAQPAPPPAPPAPPPPPPPPTSPPPQPTSPPTTMPPPTTVGP
jgi:hypothetical protein